MGRSIFLGGEESSGLGFWLSAWFGTKVCWYSLGPATPIAVGILGHQATPSGTAYRPGPE